MSSRDLLFEIGTEEIPAGFMSRIIPELKEMAEADLAELRLAFGDVRVMGTPRRIVLYVEDLTERQEDFEETVKGPPRTQALDAQGEYTKAALGFAGSRGVDTSALKFETFKGVEYLCAVVREAGKETSELLPAFLSSLLKKMVFPKNMYWDDPLVRFARPVRWIVALWGDESIPVHFGRVESGYESRGHRFMGSARVKIPSASEYESVMEREFVVVDPERRKRMIAEGIAAIESEIGGDAGRDEELLEENAHLVEYPIPFRGSFDESFLDIPEEVLIATMKKNQRYFPVRAGNGRLAAAFIGVAGNRAKDMNVVRDGNERVLRARLHDAAFFWKEDRERTLESRLPELGKVLYQEKLGSVLEKTERVGVLARRLAERLGHGELSGTVARAAKLAKADLVTGMVFEFPEVQGVMGREYARCDGEDEDVAVALFEQYLPRFAGDELPKGLAGAIVGICDRVDTIVGIHKAGMPPTGSQDPYGLRRAARCINEISWGLEMDLDLGALFAHGAELLDADDGVMKKVEDFYGMRLHNQLRERGFSHGATSLVVRSMGHRPLQALRMLHAFDRVVGAEWFGSLVLSAIRVNNILDKQADDLARAVLDRERLTETSERALLDALEEQGKAAAAALDGFDWEALCGVLSRLSPAISSFFDNVMVMDPDPVVRGNRLTLLARSRALFESIGDLSLLK